MSFSSLNYFKAKISLKVKISLIVNKSLDVILHDFPKIRI